MFEWHKKEAPLFTGFRFGFGGGGGGSSTPSAGNINATGGTKTNVGSWIVHKFTSDGNFQVIAGGGQAEFFLVGGGGGGGADNAGGGGGGAVLTETRTLAPGTYAVQIGSGGVGAYGSDGDSTGPWGAPGGATVFNLPGANGVPNIVANGGGVGASAGAQDAEYSPSNTSKVGSLGPTPTAGGRGPQGNGSGGGGRGTQGPGPGSNPPAGDGYTGAPGGANGNKGGNTSDAGGGAGGGGAGGAGANAPSNRGSIGGVGLANNWEGPTQYFGAGGSGGNENAVTGANGRASGIGGQAGNPYYGGAGAANTGSGGGGGTHPVPNPPNAGGSGSDGIMYIRYQLAGPPPVQATGGTTNTYTAGSVNYKSHKFTTGPTTFSVQAGGEIDIMLVGGGGGGGGDNAGGGGAGAVRVITNVPVVTGQSYTIQIGQGGRGSINTDGNATPVANNQAYSGGASRFQGGALDYVANGGGLGASSNAIDARPSPTATGAGEIQTLTPGGNGSGGGSRGDEPPFGAPGSGGSFGNAGGTGANGGGGGGGGAGTAGQNGDVRGSQLGGKGGAGIQNNYETGNNQWYGAGGGGGNQNAVWNIQSPTNGIGGVTNGPSTSATAGATNTGSGGGGGTHPLNGGAAGGPGVVIIRYTL